MALLTLQDIGKIYVSDVNVTVGIRGVNLSFDRGEFVAITGKSGSGKSTLLNVISGMDSYEEGELLIEGQSTSHYLQPEWEEYREKYISFIFQDYNIIESFTVLQNVELALMHIEDPKERRERAMALIKRVGLTSHVKHKGSKLSGGQKQRTVIARALAKDSPIILADEPTGNLDSVTSQEIIKLLEEVSKDKLVIVVTHNFEQVAECATRHIRIFDGAVESDHVIKNTAIKEDTSPIKSQKSKILKTKAEKKEELKKQVKNGFTLGKTIFTAKPRLSVFLCLLMIIGTMGIFLSTSMFGGASEMFEPHYMFNHIDGRVVLAKQSGEIFTEDELKYLSEEYGAQSYLHFDTLLDESMYQSIVIPCAEDSKDWKYPTANYVYGKTYGDNIIGRYPEAKNEVLLYLPISFQPFIGRDSLNVSEILICSTNYKLVGVKYYYDNNLTPECLFTEEGFRTATSIYYLLDSRYTILLTVNSNTNKGAEQFKIGNITPSFDIPADKIYIDSPAYQAYRKGLTNYTTNVKYSSQYIKYQYDYVESTKTYTFEKSFSNSDITNEKPPVSDTFDGYRGKDNGIIVSDEILCEMAEDVLSKSYKQASLFFENDKAAHSAAELMQEKGYIAVPSDTTYEPDAFTIIITLLSCIMLAFMWIASIVFLAFFINLCSSRTLGAFKGDMAIMRSMGIQVKVIKIGMYVRMLISLIPAFILVVLSAILIFTSPTFNKFFVYLYAWQYLIIFIGMIILTARTTYKQIQKLFGQSVKKSLKGGNAE